MASSRGATPIFFSRAAQYRRQIAGQDRIAERRAQFVVGDFTLFEIFLEQCVVGFGNRLAKVGAGFLGAGARVAGQFFFARLAVSVGVDEGLHREDVDDAVEGGLLAKRESQHDGLGFERFFEIVQGRREVHPLAFEARHEGNPGQLEPLDLVEDFLGFDFEITAGAGDENDAINGAHCVETFGQESGVTGGVGDDRVGFFLFELMKG
jgi:hypothetical protein